MQLTRVQISKLKQNDRKVQYELYKSVFGYMMGISLRYQQDRASAEDVVNRSFLKVIQSIDRYDVRKPLKPWLARITVNENIDACRKLKTLRSIVNFDSELIEKDSRLSPFEYNIAEGNLDADQLRAFVAQLPVTTRTVFNLFVIEGYKHHEIADRLELTTGTSKWHMNNARKKLKAMIVTMNETEKIIHYGE